MKNLIKKRFAKEIQKIWMVKKKNRIIIIYIVLIKAYYFEIKLELFN